MRLPRLRRRLFNLSAVLSLLACIVLIGAYVRSFWIADEFQRYSYYKDPAVAVRRDAFLRIDNGSIYLAYRLMSGPTTPMALSQQTAYVHQIEMAGVEPSWYFKPPQRIFPRPPWNWTFWQYPGFLFATTPGAMGAGGLPQR
jgi:hypothetical protein